MDQASFFICIETYIFYEKDLLLKLIASLFYSNQRNFKTLLTFKKLIEISTEHLKNMEVILKARKKVKK